jgi:hypothetical protein
MNERMKQLHDLALFRGDRYASPEEFAAEFARLLGEEAVGVARDRWYELNNAPAVADESPRDVGIRVGRKIELIRLMTELNQHFGLDNDK